MNRKFFVFSLLLAGSLPCTTFAADKVTEQRAISPFKSIDASGGVKLVIEAGDAAELRLEGDADDLKHYETSVSHEKLVIRPKTGWRFGAHQSVVARIKTHGLESIDASGGVQVDLGPKTTASTLGAELSGGVQLRANELSVEKLKIDASGGVSLHLAGTARLAEIEASGGVSLDARDLATSRVSIEASGGCSAKVRASEKVNGSVSGGASLKIYGKPAVVDVDSSGMGSVKRVD